MMEENDKTLLFPTHPLMHVGWGDDWKDYMLSGVLATHGYIIRRIGYGSTSGLMKVECRCYQEENLGRGILFISPMVEDYLSCPCLHWNDLRIRYRLDEKGELTDPVWVQAYAFGNGREGCWLAAVLDLVEMKYSKL